MPPKAPLPALDWQRLPAKRLFDSATLRADWDRLNASRGALPFLDSEALQTAHRCFQPRGVQLLVGSLAGQTQCLLLLQRQGRTRWTLWQPPQIPLGPLVAMPSLTLEHLAPAILTALPWTTLALSLTQLDPRHWPPPRHEPRCVVKRYISTGWIDCAQDFDHYWAARSGNLRASVGKALRRLESEGHTLTLRVLQAPAEMATAVERYGRLESSGWKGKAGTAVAAGTPQGRFYADWLTAAAARGEARVYELLLGDRVAAADLCVVRGDSLILLKIAYDEAYERYSPSTLLRQAFMRSLLGTTAPAGRPGIQRVEFFGRLMDWHRRWTGEQRSLYHLTTFRWRWLAKLRAPGSDAL